MSTAEIDLLREIRNLVDPAARVIARTFDEVADEFKAVHLVTLRDRRGSYDSTLGILRRFFSDKRFHEIGVNDVQAFRSARIRQGVKGSTVNRTCAMLSKMFTWGTERGYCLDNPVRRIRRFHESRGRVRYLKPEEIDRLLAECKPTIRTPCLMQFIMTLIYTGGRRGETLQLKWQEIDFDLGTVRFRAETTKSGESRDVPLARELADVLREWRRIQEHFGREEYVFAFAGTRAGVMRQAFEKAVRRAGISDFHYHDLRHCFASMFVQNGGDLYRLKQYLGHSSIQMTERYAHLSRRRLQEGLEFIGIPGRLKPATPKRAPIIADAPLPAPSLLPSAPASCVSDESLALLADLAALLKRRGGSLPTSRILEEMGASARWTSLSGPKMDRSRILAAMLRPMGILAGWVQSNGASRRGYRLEDLAPAIVKYLKS
ncbi:MAG TPA: site-specific integrase [Candidatus Dormibacteraeota bacterium]|nr:site-specific integrase [Candidatus Dormibacteraeota bacterium]